jgi:2-methylcitrate dehydratase PrpD
MAGGWLAETFSPPAIAALGGRLLGLSREQTNYAMGIGFNQCAGTYGATVGENGGMMAQLSQGLGAKTGVLSVLFAEAGFSAYPDVIDGRWGLYAMFGDGSYDADILTGGLGRRYDALKPGVKKYPGCGATQPVVSATLYLIAQNDFTAEDVERVDITVGESSFLLCGKDKYDPPNAADALWNYRYSVAVALARGDVFTVDFTEEAIRKTEVLALIPKIHVHSDPLLGHGVSVNVKTHDGRSLIKSLDDMEAVPEAEVLEKFKRCCRQAAVPVSVPRTEALIAGVEGMENVDKISELMGLLQ